MSVLGRVADLLGADDELRHRCTLVAEGALRTGDPFRVEYHVVGISMEGLAPDHGYEALPWCPECAVIADAKAATSLAAPEPVATPEPEREHAQYPSTPRPPRPTQHRTPATAQRRAAMLDGGRLR